MPTTERLFSKPRPSGGDGTPIATQTGSKQARQYRADLEAEGFLVAETELHHRVAYSEALEFGVAPTLFEPRGDAAKEIAELADEIEALATAKKARLKEAV